MSLTQRVKQGFLRLPVVEKALLIGSLLLTVSPLLPWYDNRNAFGVGESYLGVQGPMFAIGISVIVLGAFSFLKMLFPLLGKNFFKHRNHGLVAIGVGLQSLLLVLISNSIFFHPAFGTNVTHKTTRFGMVAAFIGIGTLVIAGYFAWRRKEEFSLEEAIGKFEAKPISPPITNYQDSPNPTSSYVPPTYKDDEIYDRDDEIYDPVEAQSSHVDSIESEGIPPRPDSPYSRPAGAYSGDPLQLDAKTRYKMLQSQNRSGASRNLWQSRTNSEMNSNSPSGSGSGFSGLDRAERQANQSTVTDNMRIRTDL